MTRPVTARDAEEVAAMLTSFVNTTIMARGRPMAPDDDFETAGVDSMGLLKILLLIEGEFGFWMPDADLVEDNIASPRALAAYICRRLETS
jgi:acyl carrier protein